MVNTIYNSTEDMINKLQELKGKTKLIVYKNKKSYYNEMKIRTFQTHQQDIFAKNAQEISEIYHDVLLLRKFLQTKPQVKNVNIKYYDLHCTIKTRDEKENVDDQYDYINFNDFITPNHYIGIKPSETILK